MTCNYTLCDDDDDHRVCDDEDTHFRIVDVVHVEGFQEQNMGFENVWCVRLRECLILDRCTESSSRNSVRRISPSLAGAEKAEEEEDERASR